MHKINELPSSWEQIDASQNHYEYTTLFLSRQKWITLAEIVKGKSFSNLLTEIESSHGKRLLLRGCSLSLSEYLLGRDFKRVLIGEEAVIDLYRDPFSKKSLQELVRRGGRHGFVKEIPFSNKSQQKIEQLKNKSKLAGRPRLIHLYRDQFQPEERCFVFHKKNGEWLAAMTLSISSQEKIQTELMLRARDAPVGVMEKLVYEIFLRLKQEGFRLWSLGEVPFIRPVDRRPSITERMVCAAGRIFNYAYNYQGLYRFKNKFSPDWREVYLCGSPAISVLALMEIFYQTKFLKLALKSLFINKIRQ